MNLQSMEKSLASVKFFRATQVYTDHFACFPEYVEAEMLENKVLLMSYDIFMPE